ncbi:MAG: TerB family tellurite resistance protein [Xenococcaceae cyanobacterium]
MKQLIKILIGAAWIDGIIQPEERKYLKRMADNKNLAEDPEIKLLLSEIKPVKPTQCYKWLEEYLGDNPSKQDYYDLLEAISALIYSDGDVDIREIKLLEQLQNSDPTKESRQSFSDKILKMIQKLYRQAVHQQI